jgi:hypothetical protein
MMRNNTTRTTTCLHSIQLGRPSERLLREVVHVCNLHQRDAVQCSALCVIPLRCWHGELHARQNAWVTHTTPHGGPRSTVPTILYPGMWRTTVFSGSARFTSTKSVDGTKDTTSRPAGYSSTRKPRKHRHDAWERVGGTARWSQHGAGRHSTSA